MLALASLTAISGLRLELLLFLLKPLERVVEHTRASASTHVKPWERAEHAPCSKYAPLQGQSNATWTREWQRST